jgi:MFS family permease
MTVVTRVRSRRPLLLLETANTLGGVSNALVMVVVPWLILQRTHSPATAGLAAALTALPGIVMAPVVGVMVDRIGRTAVSVSSDLLSALSVVLFPVLDAAGLLPVWVILVLAVVGAAFDPAGYTARKALIPDVAEAAQVSKDGVNGLHEGLFMAGWSLGPGIAAAGIATVGPVGTMWFAFGAFVLAALAVGVIGVPNRVLPDVGAPVETSSWRAARAGLDVLRRDRPVWILTLAIAAVVFIYLPTESVLLPVHFQHADEPGGFGAVLSALSIGGMLGSFGYRWLAGRLSRRGIAVGAMAVVAVMYIPIALLPPYAVMLVPGFLMGMAWGPMEPLLNSLVQDRFAAHQHGRVYGVQLSLHYAAAPTGQLAAGLAVQAFGVEPVMLAISVGLVLVACTVAALPTLHGLDVGVPAAVDPVP